MTQQPTAHEIAAAALVDLPEMTPARLRVLLTRWPDPREAVDAVRRGRAKRTIAEASKRPIAIEALAGWPAALDLERARTRLAQRGTRVLVIGDPDYPLESELGDAPAVLLVEGTHLDALVRPRVAVVGTRAATPHGIDDAHELGVSLAQAGVTVVSGLAIGIDGAAHRGALDGGGLTVGVLATGLDVVYPRRHDLLFGQVREQGVLVSEMPFGTRPLRRLFPVRNRIIAALADVVVVVEATLTGGARITAEQALEYGRPVFAMPGSRRNPSAAGCNALLADGAQPLLDPSDVLLALGMTAGARREWEQGPTRRPPPGDPATVMRALGGEPASNDQLVSRTKLGPGRVAVAVAALEREGLATRSRGMIWPR